MNAPVRITDRDRLVAAEARIAELEQELDAWRGNAAQEAVNEVICARINAMRQTLKNAYRLAGGQQPAQILMKLLSRPNYVFSRDALLQVTRTQKSRGPEERLPSIIAVRLSHLRKALDILGFPGVIESLDGAGWFISATNCAKIEAAIFQV